MSGTQIALEVAKALLQAYFAYARTKGLSEEELEQAYQEAKQEFKRNTPDSLPDV